MNTSELKEIIENGENSKIEFKSENFNNDSLAKEIVAFSNMNGGSVLIGISNDGKIEGILTGGLEEKIINICRNNVTPSIIPDLEKVKIDDKTIFKINVDKGRFKPYKVKSTNKFYVRVGSVTIEPSNEELVRLFQSGEQYHFEVSSLPGVCIEDIDLLRFRNYLLDWRGFNVEDEDLEKYLYNLQFKNDDDFINAAGLLLFGKDSSRYLPQSGIDLNCFNGLNVDSNVLDHKDEKGVIQNCIEYAEVFVRNNTHIISRFNDNETRRKDIPEYEPFIIRELVTNAFMHRDWSIFGQKVRLNLFIDGIEIFSPGGLPNTMTIDRAINGVSYYRNPIIAQILKDYGFADKLGRGLLKIFNFYKNNKMKEPIIDINDSHVKVIIFKN